MFAARTHNENAIYNHQTAAAAKPLNQGVKGLAPKTPGQKKGPLNDENAQALGKTGGGKAKGKDAGAKEERSAFVTPAGPRTARAPLGNKTTNAKALAFQTPGAAAPLSAKPSSPRLRRAKVKIHQAESDPLADDAAGEREIEYMPPRGVPLPDLPEDDWPTDKTFPQFEGGNLVRGWWSEFKGRKDGGEEELSDFEEKVRQAEARQVAGERKTAALAEKKDVQQRVRKPAAAMPRAPSTLKSRNAASALSSTSTTTANTTRATPSFAAPTAAAKARLPSAPLASRKPTPLASARHTSAKAASNTTLGYSAGRAVSAGARKPQLAGVFRQEPMTGYEVVKKAPVASDVFGGPTKLEELLGMVALGLGDESGEEGLGGLGGEIDCEEEDEEDEVFQLQAVEL
ncbi:hypothetical protein LTR08_007516 [Meristemomyces frigidus]|nr:hypothetical protein LTR08_007516 [Meristemomyces frigidus]